MITLRKIYFNKNKIQSLKSIIYIINAYKIHLFLTLKQKQHVSSLKYSSYIFCF